MRVLQSNACPNGNPTKVAKAPLTVVFSNRAEGTVSTSAGNILTLTLVSGTGSFPASETGITVTIKDLST